ncbi:hypothetical protein D5085_16010 [Ectothiorhodospiraceae bacterium BW-2]|nr:hypothetical protein D5085_16010 [Ectothiorhodospiraceae bacterium BW-2]
MFQYWGICGECHFDGKLNFSYIDGEDYDDSDALGYMLEQSCPSCGAIDNILIPMEEYLTMTTTLRTQSSH